MYSHQSERTILGNALVFASSCTDTVCCSSTELPSPEQSSYTSELLQGLGLAETTACYSFISETGSTQSSSTVCLVVLRLAGFCVCGIENTRVSKAKSQSAPWCTNINAHNTMMFAFMTLSVISCNSVELMSAELQCFMFNSRSTLSCFTKLNEDTFRFLTS